MNKKLLAGAILIVSLMCSNGNAKADVVTRNEDKIVTCTLQSKEIKVDKPTAKPTLSRGGDIGKIIPVNFTVTGYCPCSICSGNFGTNTAIGVKANHNIFAVPKEVPLGSHIYIEDFEGGLRGVAGDHGGAITKTDGNTYDIDVFYNTHKEALAVGRQHKKGYIIFNK